MASIVEDGNRVWAQCLLKVLQTYVEFVSASMGGNTHVLLAGQAGGVGADERRPDVHVPKVKGTPVSMTHSIGPKVPSAVPTVPINVKHATLSLLQPADPMLCRIAELLATRAC